MKYTDICIALYDYQAQTKEELSFKELDILYVLDKTDPDWYKAQLKTPSANGPTGLVPANYLEKVPFFLYSITLVLLLNLVFILYQSQNH